MPYSDVQEVQGLYGPFSVSEKIVQKIWFDGDFHQDDLRTCSGKSLKVLDPGRWNVNEGPDFKEARLLIDGQETFGDVEVHFHSEDWLNHGHDKNPNFDRVILHVLLYGGAFGSGLSLPPMDSLVLMPLLERDLESYVMDAALLDLEQISELEWFGRFTEMPLSKRRFLLEALAAERWAQKCSYAKNRLERADWTSCCHESALEVLGFARNRSPMHKIAANYSIDDFADGLDTDQLFEEFRDDWKLSGSRPANHPRLRLKQYAQICETAPNWPDLLLKQFRRCEAAQTAEATNFRRAAGVRKLHDMISAEVFQNVIGSKRLNSLLCDGIFPLLHHMDEGNWEPYWQHWYPGDYPDAFTRVFRQSGLSEARVPMSNGLMQGILALFASQGEVLNAT